mmetsp:Transcript_28980/g.68074  ORF Transcript_28980/g.68074 Transcript_28980/m.68074 type:complete len:234 (-) Transcript_28980:1482-2183(-)
MVVRRHGKTSNTIVLERNCRGRPSIHSSIHPSIICLPPVELFGVLPVGMELSHVLLGHQIKVFLVDFLALRVVVDSRFAVALNDVLPQQPNRFVGHLSLPGPLLRRQQILDGVLGASGVVGGSQFFVRIGLQQSLVELGFLGIVGLSRCGIGGWRRHGVFDLDFQFNSIQFNSFPSFYPMRPIHSLDFSSRVQGERNGSSYHTSRFGWEPQANANRIKSIHQSNAPIQPRSEA